jgi:hypothetical protein
MGNWIRFSESRTASGQAAICSKINPKFNGVPAPTCQYRYLLNLYDIKRISLVFQCNINDCDISLKNAELGKPIRRYYDFKKSDSLQIKIISARSLILFIQFTDNRRGTTCKKGYSSFGSTSSALLPTRNSSHHELYSW